MEPLVSVIVPVYNTGRVLKTCLDSLANQTLADIEIIVIDDASTDGSPKIIEACAASDSRFRLMKNTENQNLYETRRRGFAAAQGYYIATCDSDDYMPPSALERLYETARRTEADIVHGHSYQFINGRQFGWPINSPFKVSRGGSYVESFLRYRRGWTVWGKLYHRSVMEKALTELPVNKRLFAGEDLLFSFFLGLKAGRYIGCPAVVYHYRFSTDNFYKQPDKWPQNIADYFHVLGTIKARLEKKELLPEYDLLFEGLIKKDVAEVFSNLPDGADLALARDLITEHLGKPYLIALYGEDFSRSPLGNDYGAAGKALFPARLILFALIQLWKLGFYEFAVCFRHVLALIRRDGFKYALEKLRQKIKVR